MDGLAEVWAGFRAQPEVVQLPGASDRGELLSVQAWKGANGPVIDPLPLPVLWSLSSASH